MENKIQYCTNCGLNGHVFRNCLSPVTSYGIIAVRYNDDSFTKAAFSKNSNINNNTELFEFLLIKRKDSLSFIEFIRGKYNINDEVYVINLLKGMTQNEHTALLTKTFEELWKDVWGETSALRTHRSDYENSEKKFYQIHSQLIQLILNNPTKWTEPERGFPKGRRNPQESDINCAIREFQEETNINRSDFTIIQNASPISETFFGSNQVHYCHKYYIAICNNLLEVNLNKMNPHMAREIGDIKWCSLDEAISKIRPDNIEKREILLKAGKIMRNFHPISSNELSYPIHTNHVKPYKSRHSPHTHNTYYANSTHNIFNYY
jgi:8-oxo-dGTP pyrophosphatase MutT (NUDIX family)